ncbi:IPT/TIG domain-containing protein [Chitinophaga polysaccharea]|uniref:IPT/TIG domain-containing protein n=1 Tax=Chitinophaga polysaccharea TaxID=1293035 RepID=UPI001157D2F9|nr:IPT/TIG domain-containing protein [Chitinophaga polysaccharea]
MNQRHFRILCLLSVMLNACNKQPPIQLPSDKFNIDSIRPLFVKEGQSFTVYGKNFSPDPEKNVITINGIPVQGNVMGNRIQLKLPTGVFPDSDKLLAQLVLKKEGGPYVDTAYFYSSLTPRIYSVVPTTVRIGDTITITGEGFVKGRDEKRILFLPATSDGHILLEPGDVPLSGNVIHVSSSKIKVIVPMKAVSGFLAFPSNLPVLIPGSLLNMIQIFVLS